MANIIFSTYSNLLFNKDIKAKDPNALPYYYESLINVLKRNGNNVFVMVTNNGLIDKFHTINKTNKQINKKKLNQKIIDFKQGIGCGSCGKYIFRKNI